MMQIQSMAIISVLTVSVVLQSTRTVGMQEIYRYILAKFDLPMLPRMTLVIIDGGP